MWFNFKKESSFTQEILGEKMILNKCLWRPIDVMACNFLGPKFIGAKNLRDVLKCGNDLKKQGYEITYNLLGEHAHDLETVRKATTVMMMLIYNMRDKNIGNICCKPTLFGLDISIETLIDSLNQILVIAREKEIEVEIDAESYKYIPDTFNIFHFFAAQPRYRRFVRQAVQAHLKDIFQLGVDYKLWDKNLRIVKGSGVYEEDRIFTEQNEDIVKENYLNILDINLQSRERPYAATVRDRKLVQKIIAKIGNNKNILEFQLMYGPLGRRLGKALLKQGYTVRIYIPFVVDWCEDAWRSYGLRRAQMFRHILWEEIKDRIGG